MGLLRRIAGFLGFVRDEGHEAREEDDDDARDQYEPAGVPRKGFSVSVQVPVDRAPVGPALVCCPSGDGGVQGLRWYTKRLKIDEDGDVADEFLCEVTPSENLVSGTPQMTFPRFELKRSARAAKVRNQAVSVDGKLQHYIEHQGRLQWV